MRRLYVRSKSRTNLKQTCALCASLWDSGTRMERLFQDLRFALRVYAKNRSFTIIAVLALAIGIGSNIAVFTVSLIAMIATLGPAMRATRVDLTTVLRQ